MSPHWDDAHRRMRFETGVGAFFESALRTRYGVRGERHTLLGALGEHGLSHVDIDVVVQSHMHFDHVEGLLDLDAGDADV